jgi:NAD(P)H-nitrite reductase large subunit
MERWDVMVIGAGIAGLSAVRTIRAESTELRILLEKTHWFEEVGVVLRNGCRATEIDRSSGLVRLSDGTEHHYGSLILATGASPVVPRSVARDAAGRLHLLRSARDLRSLVTDVTQAEEILVDGMGVLAVEVAEQLRKMGKQVTLIGATPKVMPRHLNDRAGEIMEQLLLDHGVSLRYREEILAIEKRRKGGFSVSTLRGTTSFDMVAVCIGVRPTTDIAREAGLAVDRGIVVDEYLRTSDPSIYAAGDAAQHPDGSVTDLWHAAEYQGGIAGLNAIGREQPNGYPQFRLKCEVFDTYFFSVAKPDDLTTVDIKERETSTVYQCFFYSNETLSGAVMVYDRERAPLYQQAVREGWDRGRVDRELR